MGHSQAVGMAEAVRDGMDLDGALQYHLQYNHYPPHPASMVRVAHEAITKCNIGAHTDHVRLPDGVSWRGLLAPTAGEMVEALHLGPFLEVE